MKTRDGLFQKNRFTPRVSRFVLKSNSQHVQTDSQGQDVRSPWKNHPAIRKVRVKLVTTLWTAKNLKYLFLKSSGRTQDARTRTRRWSRSSRIPNIRNSSSQSLGQTQKINKFSRESRDFIVDLINIEILELCENSSKQQCPDCNVYWGNGITFCSCGRNMKSS